MELIPTELQLENLKKMAKAAHESGFYSKVGNEAGLFSIMLLANELGVQPMQALSGGIWNINGKIEMSSRLMNMKIRQAGHKLEVIEHTTDGCVIKGTRKDTGEYYTATFKKNDADRAKCLDKPIWKNYPREMYFARALSILARILFPDVIGNCYVEGEISKEIDLEIKESPESTPKVEVQNRNSEVMKELIEKLATTEEELNAYLDHAQAKYDLSAEKLNELMKVWSEKINVVKPVYEEWIKANPLNREGS